MKKTMMFLSSKKLMSQKKTLNSIIRMATSSMPFIKADKLKVAITAAEKKTLLNKIPYN